MFRTLNLFPLRMWQTFKKTLQPALQERMALHSFQRRQFLPAMAPNTTDCVLGGMAYAYSALPNHTSLKLHFHLKVPQQPLALWRLRHSNCPTPALEMLRRKFSSWTRWTTRNTKGSGPIQRSLCLQNKRRSLCLKSSQSLIWRLLTWLQNSKPMVSSWIALVNCRNPSLSCWRMQKVMRSIQRRSSLSCRILGDFGIWIMALGPLKKSCGN